MPFGKYGLFNKIVFCTNNDGYVAAKRSFRMKKPRINGISIKKEAGTKNKPFVKMSLLQGRSYNESKTFLTKICVVVQSIQ